jgi:putative flippase GtrA
MIQRELGIFLIVGTLTVLVDYGVYRGVVWFDLIDVHTAKGIGFLSGTLFAYFANRFWTFGHKQHSPGSVWRFCLLYSLTLGANVLVNGLILRELSEIPAIVQVAFIVATGVSATLNFLGMKFFVFHSKTHTGLR